MASPKAPVLDLTGKKAKDVTLAEAVFAAEINNRPRQRVLVIRAHQNGRSSLNDLPVIAGPYLPRR